MKEQAVRLAMMASAIFFAALGLALLFAAREVTALLGSEIDTSGLHELFGAALLGMSSMNWISRDAVLGGIYGRAVVACNQTHVFVGAILLIKRGLETSNGSVLYWVVSGIYVLAAFFFSYLLFFSGGIKK